MSALVGLGAIIILAVCASTFQNASREARDRSRDQRSNWEAKRSLRLYRDYDHENRNDR